MVESLSSLILPLSLISLLTPVYDYYITLAVVVNCAVSVCVSVHGRIVVVSHPALVSHLSRHPCLRLLHWRRVHGSPRWCVTHQSAGYSLHARFGFAALCCLESSVCGARGVDTRPLTADQLGASSVRWCCLQRGHVCRRYVYVKLSLLFVFLMQFYSLITIIIINMFFTPGSKDPPG